MVLKFWMQDYRFTLKTDILPNSSPWTADPLQSTVSSITKAYSEVLFKVLLKYTIYDVYE